jgi:hypothetical protein
MPATLTPAGEREYATGRADMPPRIPGAAATTRARCDRKWNQRHI